MSIPAEFLFRTHRPSRERNVVSYETVASRAIELIDSKSPAVKHIKILDSEFAVRESKSLERRTSFLMAVLAAHENSQLVAESANACLEMTVKGWEAGHGSSDEGVAVLDHATRVGAFLEEGVLERGGRALLGLITAQLQQKEDFEALVRLSTVTPGLFAAPHRSLRSWSIEFREFLHRERFHLLEEIDDPDWLEEEMRVISRIALALEVDISEFEYDVEVRMDELRTGWEPDCEDELRELYQDEQDESDESDDEVIDSIFQSLL